jgi:hypothetical protein
MSFLRSKDHSFLKGFGSLATLPFQMFVFNFGQLVAKKNPRLAYGVCAIKKIKE